MLQTFGREPLADKSSLLLHRKRPDYEAPPLAICTEQQQGLHALLDFLYGEDQALRLLPEVIRLLRVHHAHKTPEMVEAESSFESENMFTERDIVVIT